MRKSGILAIIALLLGEPCYPRQDLAICGTNQERAKEVLFLHRQAVRLRQSRGGATAQSASPPASVARDAGNIAILEDSDGVVARPNPIPTDFGQKTIAFLPSATSKSYGYQTDGSSYDTAAVNSGVLLPGLGDDDSRLVTMPFSFPFFGSTYHSVYVNSDGNLTFSQGDSDSAERSLGKMTSGPPRIAPLFRDLDPSSALSQGVWVFSDASRLVVSWVQVPEYGSAISLQTFQVRLYATGRIEFAYQSVETDEAVVGIAPGNFIGPTSLVSFTDPSSQQYQATIAERFGSSLSIDLITAAQRFYATHDDSYDYLVFFNNMGIPSASGAVAFEMTVRNVDRSGYGDIPADDGMQYGSPSRLQAVMNMGPLSQYPDDPNAVVPLRTQAGDTPLTVIGHEAGHLFLAYASVLDPNNPDAKPMLGRQAAHWSFLFNSEASLLEGERIQDNGITASPRFQTVATVKGYAPLDQYLMGFRAPEEVPPTFLVTNPSPGYPATKGPQVGVNFNGNRRDITIGELVQVMGRRTPDYTVAQSHFRFAFILVVATGQEPTASDLQKFETFRSNFETFYHQASSQRAWADASLLHSLKLSLSPAAGVLAGSTTTGIVKLASPAQTDTTVLLKTTGGDGAIMIPSSVIIPAGSDSASFAVSGTSTGVVQLTGEVAGGGYEIANANMQVLSSVAGVRLELVSGSGQTGQPGVPLPEPIVARVVDVNKLKYSGLKVRATPSPGGQVSPDEAITDRDGAVSFQWTPGPQKLNELKVELEGAPPASSLTITAVGQPFVTATGVVSAASYAAGLCPGGLASVFGTNLAAGVTDAAKSVPLPVTLSGVQILLNGIPAPLLYVSDRQINFLAPGGLQSQNGQTSLVVSTLAGASSSVSVPVMTIQPGIFYDTQSGIGAILIAGTGKSTAQQPANPGDMLEIYATGLGPLQPSSTHPGLQETHLAVQVLVGGLSADVLFSGGAPGFVGLYQVNARVPDGTPSGHQQVILQVSDAKSNAVQIAVH